MNYTNHTNHINSSEYEIDLDYTNYTINSSENKNCFNIIKIIQTILIAANIIIAFDYTNYLDYRI